MSAGLGQGPTCLVFHPSSELYGSDRMAVETCLALKDGGYRPTLLVPTDGPLVPYSAEQGIEVSVFGGLVLRKRLRRPTAWAHSAGALFRSVLSAVRLIRGVRPRIVYANTLTQPQYLLAARLAGVPSICHVREIENDASRWTRRALTAPLHLARGCIANSDATQEFITSSCGLRPDKVAVIHNGKDWSSYFTSEPQRTEGTLRVVCVGRLSPRKGQDVLLRAVALLAERGMPTTTTLVGSAYPGYEAYVSGLKEQIAQLPVGATASLVGFSEDVAPFLAEADVVVVPSRQEPFGTVAVEGMAAMRPVVASSTEGLSEVVTHDVDGLLFEPANADELALRLLSLAEDGELARRLAENGRLTAVTRFSSEAYRKSIVDYVALHTPS